MLTNTHRQKKIEELASLGRTLDSKFTGPLGFKFGLDGIIGLIPGIGDFTTSALSLYIIAQSAYLGVSVATLIRMSLNVLFENIFDLIPFFGNLFDFYWKANNKNIDLLLSHLKNPSRETIQSRMVVGLVFIALLSLLVISCWISFRLLRGIYFWIISQTVT